MNCEAHIHQKLICLAFPFFPFITLPFSLSVDMILRCEEAHKCELRSKRYEAT
ncbi:hypothetical protein BDV24DRAFT_139374 [Aspergillus arachidicola]|uniref:Uncharacterized protein n=1 Tax=Aspergillus arachidicola TaxID=656916 RepID=A0A5N6XZW2_9EURO|nr:hypothetical protein BDV24DRAFT_139374 [Aspergillus arachidicola]